MALRRLFPAGWNVVCVAIPCGLFVCRERRLCSILKSHVLWYVTRADTQGQTGMMRFSVRRVKQSGCFPQQPESEGLKGKSSQDAWANSLADESKVAPKKAQKTLAGVIHHRAPCRAVPWLPQCL